MACVLKCWYDHKLNENKKKLDKEGTDKVLTGVLLDIYKNRLKLDTQLDLVPNKGYWVAPPKDEMHRAKPWILDRKFETYEKFKYAVLEERKKFRESRFNYGRFLASPYRRFLERVIEETDKCLVEETKKDTDRLLLSYRSTEVQCYAKALSKCWLKHGEKLFPKNWTNIEKEKKLNIEILDKFWTLVEKGK